MGIIEDTNVRRNIHNNSNVEGIPKKIVNVRYELVKDGEIDFKATELRRLELTKTGTAEEAYLRYFYDAINISPI